MTLLLDAPVFMKLIIIFTRERKETNDHKPLNSPAVLTDADQLEPVLLDNIEALLLNARDKCGDIITTEVFGTPASLADEQMLVSFGSGNVAIATAGLVDTLYQPGVHQLLKRAIDRHQTQLGVECTPKIVNLNWAESTVVPRYHLRHNFQWLCEAAAIVFKTGIPLFKVNREWIRHKKHSTKRRENENHFHFTAYKGDCQRWGISGFGQPISLHTQHMMHTQQIHRVSATAMGFGEVW
jgi:hypothetical protein